MSNFKKVWQIVMALKSQDDMLSDCIEKFRIQLGDQGKISFGGDELDKFKFDKKNRRRKFMKDLTGLDLP